MDADKYTVLTPMGALTAIYEPEDDDGNCAPVRWEGDADAMDYLRLVVRGCVDARGSSINIDHVAPDTLEHFCSPDGSGVVVVPSPEILAERAMQKAEKQAPEFSGVRMDVTQGAHPSVATFDSAAPAMSAIEKLKILQQKAASRRET